MSLPEESDPISGSQELGRGCVKIRNETVENIVLGETDVKLHFLNEILLQHSKTGQKNRKNTFFYNDIVANNYRVGLSH